MTTQFSALKTQLFNQMQAQGMTFNPSIDCRNDLVNFYGYTFQQVNTMSDDQVFSIMDKIEDGEEGCFDSKRELPIHIQNNKCSCGGSFSVTWVDCETRGDCEIYHCECTKCSSETSFNYAEEWYVYDEFDAFGDILNSLDNACYGGRFNQAKTVLKEAEEFILKGNDKTSLTKMLDNKINKLSERYPEFRKEEVIQQEELDTRPLCEVKELSIRSYTCLKRAGYDTVQQVKEASLEDMYKVRNLGRNSLTEIEEVLNIKFI